MINTESYFLLGLGVRNDTFLLVVTFYNLLFPGPGGRGGEGLYSLRDGGSFEGAQVDFFVF